LFFFRYQLQQLGIPYACTSWLPHFALHKSYLGTRTAARYFHILYRILFVEIVMSCNCDNSKQSYMGRTRDRREAVHDYQVPGMAYVPWQHWGEVYEPCKALERGTLYPVLDKPFKGGRCG
jgi:hypothetical protein